MASRDDDLLPADDFSNILLACACPPATRNPQWNPSYQGWPDHAPFDAIIVTCAPDQIPQPLVGQLQGGGRTIIPVGPPNNQQLYLLQKHGTKVEQQAILPVRFVPMKRAQ